MRIRRFRGVSLKQISTVECFTLAMTVMRFSAAPAGRLSDRTIPWSIFGDQVANPDGLEDSALAGANLASIASSAGSPMFEKTSLFGAHVAAQSLGRDPAAPVVVFVHSYGYEPRRPVLARARSDNPHRCLYHFCETESGPGSREERQRHTTPWLSRIMLPGGQGAIGDCEGLAVTYAYASQGGFHLGNFPSRPAGFLSPAGAWQPWRQPNLPYANAYADAESAGQGLAAILSQLRFRLNGEGLSKKPIDVFCHGLGARVIMIALKMLSARRRFDPAIAGMGRIVLVNGACYWGQAAEALVGMVFADMEDGPTFYNFTNRSDRILRHLGARATQKKPFDQASANLSVDAESAKLLRGGRTIGLHGAPPSELYAFGGDTPSQWVDLDVHSRRFRRWARSRGFAPRSRVYSDGDHWGSLSHPSAWDIYRSILQRDPRTEPEEIYDEMLAPDVVEGVSGKLANAV